MYSLMGAGNFMWGVWSRYIGLTNSEVWAGSNLNEFYNLGDSVAGNVSELVIAIGLNINLLKIRSNKN